MGTRNLTLVVKDGNIRVAQYCQWDGYPGGNGQGTRVFNFITQEMTPAFREQVDRVIHLTPDEVHNRWKSYGADDSGLVSMDIVSKFKVSNAHLDRDMGAGILSYIQNAQAPEVELSTEFAADSLFCEWAYLLDLDNDILEVYRGFNKTPLLSDERFKFLQTKSSEYYPIRLAAKYSFNSLKSDFKNATEWGEHVKQEASDDSD